jgi:ribonucleoside-diphosphate reductase alpha chain
LKGDEDYTFHAKIKKITSVKNQDVYDITTESNHNFFANNILVSNCGEIPGSAWASCALLLINLFNHVKNPFTKDASFDFDLLSKHAIVAQRLMDDMVDLEIERIDRIIKKIKSDPEPENVKINELGLWENIRKTASQARRTGTGSTALGDVFAAMGLKYGSDESIKLSQKIFKTIKLGCYRSSVDMSKELGPFPIWDHNLEKENPFLLRIEKENEELYKDMKKYGRRNISLLTLSPAGSASILTQTSSGIEPLLKQTYKRRKKVNPNDKNARVDFKDDTGDSWQEFEVVHPKLKMWMDITGEKDISKSPWANSLAEDINWEKRIELQSVIQKNIDHGISSTLCLPEDISVAEVKKIYESAWEMGLKGVTIYREGSRSGVIIDSNKNTNKDKIIKVNAVKRPDKLPCNIHHVKITKRLDKPRHFEYIVAVGLFKDDPYEIFAFENGKLDKKYEKGYLVKKKRGHYDIEFDDGTILDNIMKDQTEEEEVVTRLISTSLRHGTDISFIVHQLEKTRGDLLNFTKSISRTLKHYIKDGVVVSGEDCPVCIKNGIKNTIVRKDGCQICNQCGYSKCS